MKSMFLSDIQNVLYARLKQDGNFSHPKLDYVMYVKRVQGKKLIDPVFMHRESGGHGFDFVARAREAEILVDIAQQKVLVHMRHCHVSSRNEDNAYVEDRIWPIDFPVDIAADRKTKRTDMTWEELIARQKTLQEDIDRLDVEIALKTASFSLTNPPDQLVAHVKNLRNQRQSVDALLRDVQAEMQRRPALALGCLCFVLVGCPVGIWFSRSDYLSAFVICFLPIVLLYYPLLLCGENLARAGTVNVALGVWTADVLLAGVAFLLFWRLVRS